jgi:hypothetical protein
VRERHGSWKGQTCLVEDCNRPIQAKGLCANHYYRKRLYGNPDGTFATTKKCVECGAPAVAGDRSSDYCREHYVAFVKQQIAAGRLQGCRSARGYVYHSIFKKTYAEHAIVMEHLLGRPLRLGENVHHRNGVKHDNRPENLELWVKPQAAGQRVQDLVAWIVESYPQYVKEALGLLE